MILSSKNVIPYLLERGILTPTSVVNGDVQVVEASRRNRNFKLMRQDSPGLFIKQVQLWDQPTTTALRREAVCCWMATKETSFAPLTEVVPKYEFYDPVLNILVTGLVPGAENLSEHHYRLGRFPTETAAALGCSLRRYHGLMTQVEKSAYAVMFSRIPPWILSVHQQAAQSFNAISAGNSQMLAVIRQYPDYQRHLDVLRDLWRVDSLIHGDMKWDNCLVEPSFGQPEAGRLRIVDWELADFGDAAWDVGAIFQAYVSFWILSIPFSMETPVNLLAERARYPLKSMHPALQAFWQSYQTGGSPEADWPGFLERSVKYAAARMIQTVYEHMYQAPQLTSSALALLQVSLNMLHRPTEARQHLLGL
jgi:hypothetical protein